MLSNKTLVEKHLSQKLMSPSVCASQCALQMLVNNEHMCHFSVTQAKNCVSKVANLDWWQERRVIMILSVLFLKRSLPATFTSEVLVSAKKSSVFLSGFNQRPDDKDRFILFGSA